MTIDQDTLQYLTDIGFMLLVCFACAKSLLGHGTDGESRREKWREELKDLEASLRGIIAEASAASSNLDRNLLQRKRELEQLLGKLEQHELSADGPGTTTAPVSGYNRAKQPLRAAAAQEDLPNPSWSTSAASFGQEPARAPEVKKEAPNAGWSLGLTDPQSALSNEIEVVNEDPLERETFAQMSIMDPITYKVARRLLAAGKEIHVVARKLELPISEIRLLDRLMRRETAAKTKRDSDAEEPLTSEMVARLAAPEHNGEFFSGVLFTATDSEDTAALPALDFSNGTTERTLGIDRSKGSMEISGIERETTLL